MAGTIRLVVFDANGVLHDNAARNEYLSTKTGELFASHNLHPDSSIEEKFWPGISSKASRGEITVHEADSELFAALGIPLELLDDYERIDEESFGYVKLTDPDLRDRLIELKEAGIRLAVLSNTMYGSSAKSELLDLIGLSGIFDGIFASNEIGHMKPEREAYEAALHHFGCSAAEAVFVGHGKEELDGAKAAGMHTVSYKGYAAVDFLAKNFGEIVEYVKGL